MTPLSVILRRLADALLRVTEEPQKALPPDAGRELEMWDAETVARYHAEGGGVAPPDAPHIDFDDKGGI